MTDNLKTCDKCNSLFCYSQTIAEGITIERCLGCGFQHYSLYSNEKFMEEQLKLLPELYKDLITYDSTGKTWLPSFQQIEGKGIIFANGTSKDEWGWSAAKMKQIPKDQQHLYPIPGQKNKYYSERADMSTIQHFSKDEYLQAMDYLGLL